MAFVNQGQIWNMADSGAMDLGGNDWYDAGDFTSPADGGYPGGIPGYDGYAVGDVTPSGGGAAITGANPDTGAVKMDFTGMAPGSVDTLQPGSLDFGPGAVNMPSGGVYDILNTPVTPVQPTNNDWTPLTVGGQTLSPADYTGAADNLVVNQGPSQLGDQIDNTGFGDYLSGGTIPGTGTDLTPGSIDYGPSIPDTGPITPYTGPEIPAPATPIDETPTIEIVDKRPDTVRPVIPETPPFELTPVDTTIPVIEAPDILEPVPPVQEPEVPTIEVVDKRPKTQPPVIEVPPYNPPVITPGDILEPVPPVVVPPTPPVPPVVVPPTPPVPPVVVPPTPPVPPVVVPPTPPVPPVVVPPTPPVVQPPIVNPQTGEMINPGFIQPTAFYNTTNPAQSKFFWGGHGPQFGTTQFNARAYNQAAAPQTPWGLGQVAAPLSPAEIQQAIAGTYQSRLGTAPATRAEAYQPQTLVAPQYGQVKAGAPVAPVAPTATGSTTKELYSADQKTAISQALGSDWQSRLDKAALNGDYATIVDIQKQIDAVLNPVVDRY